MVLTLGREGGGAFVRLPSPLSSLVGRVAEIAAVGELLRDPHVRLVTLTGPGGVGKTRLALAAAAACAPGFADGAVFVPLAAITDPDLVLPALARALGLRPAATRSVADQLVGALGASRRLVIFDNLEQVLDAAPAVAELLAACPGLTALVTSRERVRISGEHVFAVAPLSLRRRGGEEASRRATGNGIDSSISRRLKASEASEASDAVALFALRAREACPGFVLTGHDLPIVTEICARLDGLPLAIELAAARVPLLPPSNLLARLGRRLPLLIGGPRDQPARQRTLRDTVAWSYDLLPPPEQALFRSLAVFVDGFTLEAADAVRREVGALRAGEDAEMEGEEATTDTVESLLSRSLLRVEPGPNGGVRVHMLETIREYAGEILAATGEAAAVHAAHAAWCLRYAERCRRDRIPVDDRAQLNDATAELPNLRAALGWLVANEQLDDAIRLVSYLGWFWNTRGDLREGASWLEWAQARDEALPLPLRAELRTLLGLIVLTLGDPARAEAHAAAGLAFGRAGNDPFEEGRALVVLGAAVNGQGDFGRARALLEEAVALTRVGPPSRDTVALMSAALGNLGVTAHGQGDLAAAARIHRESLEGYRAAGSLRGQMVALSDIGDVSRDQGNEAMALAAFREGLDLAWSHGENRMVAEALEGIAAVRLAGGAAVWSVRLLGAADRLRETAGIGMWLEFNRAAYERGAAAGRQGLGDAGFAAAWEAGRALSLPDAVAAARSPAVPSLADPAPAASSPTLSSPAALTPRETAVLRLLVAGHTDAAIAAELFVSVRTVEHHVANILGKLSVRTRTAAASAAIAAGLVAVGDAAPD